MEFVQKMPDRFKSPELPPSEEQEEQTCNDEQCLTGFPKQRSHTDLPFLMLHAAVIIVFLCLEGYCIANIDINKCDYWNICNTTNEGIRDATDTTVNNPGSVELMSRGFSVYSLEIISLCGIAAVTSYMLLFLLRCSAMVFFYIVSIGGIIVCIPFFVVFWSRLMINQLFIVPVATSSFVVLVLVMITIYNRKGVSHATQMFDETGKYTGGASNPFSSSAMTLVSVSIVWWSWLYFARLIESADVPFDFALICVRWCARWCNVIVMLWMVQFIYECQGFVLAGSISSRIFNRETTSGSSSTFSFIKYHLGTVSKNSLILIFMQLLYIIFFLFRMMMFVRFFNILFIYCFALCEIANKEIYLTFLTRGVSTLTAMYGYSFQKSTKTLRRFWEENTALPLLGPTALGGFILLLAKMFVVIVTTLISRFLINIPSIDTEINKWTEIYLLCIIALLAYLIANCILRVYEMSTNTIVVCYCLDCDINNGTTRPYCMTAAFREFTEVCKTSLEDEMKREEETP